MAAFEFTMTVGPTSGSEIINTSDARAIEYLDDLRELHYSEIDDGGGGTRPMTRNEVAVHHLQGHRRGEIEFARALKQRRLDSGVAVGDDLEEN